MFYRVIYRSFWEYLVDTPGGKAFTPLGVRRSHPWEEGVHTRRGKAFTPLGGKAFIPVGVRHLLPPRVSQKRSSNVPVHLSNNPPENGFIAGKSVSGHNHLCIKSPY